MDIVIATPLNGARIRKPDGQILKPEGERVTRDSFWVRRAADGDVKLTIASKAPAQPVAAQPKKPSKAAKK
jgi:hypothetical protein